MLSPNKPKTLRVTEPVDIETIVLHMAGSIGEQKARAVVQASLARLTLRTSGTLTADEAETLFSALTTEEGLVGLAAKVAKQMVRLKMSPIR